MMMETGIVHFAFAIILFSVRIDMYKTEFKSWLKRNPDAKLKCKFCQKSLPQEAVVNFQDYHGWCLKSKAKRPSIEMACHVDNPYPAQFRFNR